MLSFIPLNSSPDPFILPKDMLSLHESNHPLLLGTLMLDVLFGIDFESVVIQRETITRHIHEPLQTAQIRLKPFL